MYLSKSFMIYDKPCKTQKSLTTFVVPIVGNAFLGKFMSQESHINPLDSYILNL